jgi:hypothetical protein
VARPFKYTPEQLEKKIEEYFQKKEREGKEKKLVFCSIRDLASYLKIDLQTWYNYDSRSDYSSITKKARDRIIAVWEQQLFYPGRNASGAIFYLKNFGGMADKVEHTHSGQIEHKHQYAARIEDLSTEQLQTITAALEALQREKDSIDVTPKKLEGQQGQEEEK